jgi:hypothetical protein
MKLRFTLRELILFTAIVAIALGWWIDHRRLTRELQAFGGTLRDRDKWDECTTLAEAVHLVKGKLATDGKRDVAALLTEDRVREALQSAIICMDKHAATANYPTAVKEDWQTAKPIYQSILNTDKWPAGAVINGFYGFSDNVHYHEGVGLRVQIPIRGNLDIHELPILQLSFGHF